jgi:hypothetical protein
MQQRQGWAYIKASGLTVCLLMGWMAMDQADQSSSNSQSVSSIQEVIVAISVVFIFSIVGTLIIAWILGAKEEKYRAWLKPSFDGPVMINFMTQPLQNLIFCSYVFLAVAISTFVKNFNKEGFDNGFLLPFIVGVGVFIGVKISEKMWINRQKIG